MFDNKHFGDYLWQGVWLILPLNPYFSQKGEQTYRSNIFEIMRKADVTFKELKDFLNSYVEFRNKFFLGSPSNSEYFLQMKNQRFAFGIYDEFHLWNDSHTALGNIKINTDKPPTEDFVKWITKTCENYCNGIVNCSDCGKEIEIEDVAGRYFAGVYCYDCWNSKWKAIEAKESYD